MASVTDSTNDERSPGLSWSGRWTLAYRILAVNILTVALLALSLLYLNAYRNQLSEERVRQAAHEAQLIAGALAAVPEPARLQLLERLAPATQSRIRLYGPAGERRLTELELPWLPGYEGSLPVRIGNGAAQQFQLDVYGELMDSLHDARDAGIDPDPAAWHVQGELMGFLETAWERQDEGIWEVRGPRRHFVHSKVCLLYTSPSPRDRG